ncbi:sigma factor-like helix-turn-helix DNA-binding protein [Desulfitibacter alkalitolerans]|uniref:sigma factor-like helix-turn-helix DNA-binding protein n=1 Tax=Desulfitibacter alkalitolerans TaxID=264641 RepID=UPI000480061F|nr:sigma factor-like helix-turn-helix DNA-binding protein [Desulfitibacter alkalitolerans]
MSSRYQQATNNQEVLDLKHVSFPTKLYNLAYRITGNTLIAEKIALEALDNLAKQGLCAVTDEVFQGAAREIVELTLTRYPYHISGHSEGKDTFPHLQEILNALPVRERLTVVLRDICGFSSVQVAALMDTNKESIQQLLASARCKVCKTNRGDGSSG